MSVRTDVPINLHPASLANAATHLEIENTPGNQAITVARNAMQAVHDGYAAIEDAEKALRSVSGQTRLVDGKPQIVANPSKAFGEAANARFKVVAPSVDNAMKQLNGIAQVLEKRVGDAIADPTANTPQGISVAAEVRAHLKALSPTERTSFVRSCLQAGDRKSLNAVLNAPAYLSGMDADAQNNLKMMASNHFAPQDWAQLNATRDVMTRVSNAGSVLLGRVQRAAELARGPAALAADAIKALAG